MDVNRKLRKIRVQHIFILVLLVSTISIVPEYTLAEADRDVYDSSDLGKQRNLEVALKQVWTSLFLPQPKAERYAHVTAETLERAMRMGADWIISMQEDSGRFRYWYNPDSDEFSENKEDNFLRQAGTSFSLVLVYEMTGDPRYLDAARNSVQYLLNYKKPLGKDKTYFLFRRKSKLGGISLPMLTMLKIRQLTGASEFDDILKKLANMILYLQKKYNTGQFKSTYVYRGDYEYEKNSRVGNRRFIRAKPFLH